MLKTCIVYDWADQEGGAERLLEFFANNFSDADFYTSYCLNQKPYWAKNIKLNLSFVNKLPNFIKKNKKLIAPLLPLAFECFNLQSYNNVIVVSSSFAKGVITRPNQTTTLIALTPPRWLYHESESLKQFKLFKFLPFLKNSYFKYLKAWDSATITRYTNIFAISNFVKQRLTTTYGNGIQATVLYPAFNYNYWHTLTPQMPQSFVAKEYFLVVNRLAPYKLTQLAINAFAVFVNKNPNFKLVIVGKGELQNTLKKLTQKLNLQNNILWYKDISDAELKYLYTNANALVMPQTEDFGYTACEAAACTCPVLCYKTGGQTEIILNEKNGLYVCEQTTSAFAQGLEEIKSFKYNVEPYENSHIRGWSWHTFVAALTQKIPKTI